MSEQRENLNSANQNQNPPLNSTNQNLDSNFEVPRESGDGEESAAQLLIGGLPQPPLNPPTNPTNQRLTNDLNTPSSTNPVPPVNPLDPPPPYVDQSSTTIGFTQNPIGGQSHVTQLEHLAAAQGPTTFPLLDSPLEKNPPAGFLADNPQPVNPQSELSAIARQPPDEAPVHCALGGIPEITHPQQLVWKPNRKLLTDIVGLGFSEISAEKALFYTGNESADLAVGWILDNPDSQTDLTPLCFEGTVDDSREASRGSIPSSAGSSPGPLYDQWRPSGQLDDEANMFKMVFAVNSSLKMGLGKMAAQVGHATLGLYRNLERNPKCKQWLNEWRDTGETKIVVRAEDIPHLAELERRADLAGLQSFLVHDAGRTQIAAGSATVLSIFGPSSKVDEVTGSLKLL